MDAVILAGGRGNRVHDIVPAFYKPLLTTTSGIPLVCRAVDLALEAGVHTPVVVVAPANAEAIARALDSRRAALIIQREPLGPGHALLTGLSVQPRQYIESDRVLVLLSDNVMSTTDINAVTAFETAVGVRLIERREAQRFTRYESGKWIEKKPIEDLDGPPLPCWVGPLVVWRRNTQHALRYLCREAESASGLVNREVLIGPYLSELMKTPDSYELVQVSALDIGTTETYGNYKWKEARKSE